MYVTCNTTFNKSITKKTRCYVSYMNINTCIFQPTNKLGKVAFQTEITDILRHKYNI